MPVSDVLHFGVERDAEQVLDGHDDLVLQGDDFIGRGLACDIHKYERLLFIDPDIAFPVAFPSALLYQPCRRNLYEA